MTRVRFTRLTTTEQDLPDWPSHVTYRRREDDTVVVIAPIEWTVDQHGRATYRQCEGPMPPPGEYTVELTDGLGIEADVPIGALLDP